MKKDVSYDKDTIVQYSHCLLGDALYICDYTYMFKIIGYGFEQVKLEGDENRNGDSYEKIQKLGDDHVVCVPKYDEIAYVYICKQKDGQLCIVNLLWFDNGYVDMESRSYGFTTRTKYKVMTHDDESDHARILDFYIKK